MNSNLRLQILFWVVIAGLTLGVASSMMSFERALFVTLVNMVCYSIVYYTNTLYLFPKYYKEDNNHKYALFIVILVIVATSFVFVMEYFVVKQFGDVSPQTDKPSVVIVARSFFLLMLMVIIGTVYRIQTRLREHLLLNKEIQENKLKTELKLLRSQINPHFLFNALNNIYALSYMKSDKASESIIKLSSMLRYVIEDCIAETTPLKSEIEYIENYIAFQKMKSPDDMNVVFKYDQLNLDIEVAPMLFIPFLENSFKYSKIEEFQNAYIVIEIKSDNNQELIFSVSNSIPPTAKARSGAGTGINNVRQRLNIIYPDKHKLAMHETKDMYSVTLNIETNEA